jgi:hypothetical protein
MPTDRTQVAEHAGYQRTIIHRNPPLIDEEGYDIDSDDDEEQVQEAVASAMEENPYSSIRLEGAAMTLPNFRPPATSADQHRNPRSANRRHRPAVTSHLLATVYLEVA